MHAEGRAHEPYPCFEQAAGKIEGRLRRYKTRLRGRAGASAGNGHGKVVAYLVEPPREMRTKNPPRATIRSSWRREPKSLKSLSVASAVAELDLSGAPVVVFRHAGSGRVNVVYRRRDGAIGWLDPH